MLNTLDDYIGHSLPEQGEFTTNPGLGRKVSPEGSFLPFRGIRRYSCWMGGRGGPCADCRMSSMPPRRTCWRRGWAMAPFT